MILFKIIDKETGKEPTDKVITAQARLGNLITRDIDGFYVGEDGQIILVDDCGNCTWLDMNRFKVELHTGADEIVSAVTGLQCIRDYAVENNLVSMERYASDAIDAIIRLNAALKGKD